jgi:glyoxylase-like metal-dependent hydrolase (beta-lactamase superfamily II)
MKRASYIIVSMLLSAITFLFSTLNIASCAEAPTEVRGAYQMMVGDFEVILLSDGVNKRLVEQQLQLLYGNKEKMTDMLARAYPDGQMESTVNAFLINTGAKLVLVDTGNGKMGSSSMGNVIHNLRAAGYQPEKIDEVYLTHMHGDHIGGLVSGEECVFPNATVYAQKREAEYWLSDSNLNAAPANAKRGFQAAKTILTPYINSGKFKTFEGNVQLSPGIRAEALFGHTPGHTAYFVESKGQTLVLWGDIIHVAAVQFEDPSVTIAYDSDKAEAAKTRQQILSEAANNHWLIGGAHIEFPGLGYVQTNGGDGYIFVPLNFPATE